MIEFFKPTDFICKFTIRAGAEPLNPVMAATYANEKLNQAMGPEVFGTIESTLGCYRVTSPFRMIQAHGDTHTARLFQIQPIEKKCEHKEVQIFDLTVGNLAFRCVDCKKMVGPRNGWEEVK